MSLSNNTATFVLPYYPTEKNSRRFLDDTLEGLFKQTDADWVAVIIDDASPESERKYLDKLRSENREKIRVVHLDKNVGQGVCRNIGVSYAKKHNSPIVLFNDSDDISHPRRLEVVRDAFQKNNKIDLIYSTVEIINEHSEIQPCSNISPSILEILESHRCDPVEGYDAWIRIGTETGYTNKTSSTAVRTEIAYHCPFPAERISEDSHTWMRMSAHGAYFKYVQTIPTLYRIPSYVAGQASRERVGNNTFNKIKIKNDTEGFEIALNIALSRGSIKPDEVAKIKSQFFKRLSKTMEAENEDLLVKELNKKTCYYVGINSIYVKSLFTSE